MGIGIQRERDVNAISGGGGQVRGLRNLRLPPDALRPMVLEGATAVLCGHLGLCEDEYWRMVRAFDRGRPLQRVYARLRRIVIMLDLSWGCHGDDPDGAVGRAIEALMTWQPTLKKGRRLPLPPQAVYRVALEHLAAIGMSPPVAAAIARLGVLPLEPVDWQISGDVMPAMRNLRDCYAILCALLRRAIEPLAPAGWDWLHIADEGIFKLMAIEDCALCVANPATGEWRRFRLPDVLREGRLGLVVDSQVLAEIEGRCAVALPRADRLHGLALPALPQIEVGSWISRPVLGQVVGIAPAGIGVLPLVLRLEDAPQDADPNIDPCIRVRLLGGTHLNILASATRWNTLASPDIARDPRRLAARIGGFIEAHELARREGRQVAAHLNPTSLFRMPANLDRVLALWIGLHLDYLLSRSRAGRSIRPGGFNVFRRATALGAYERNALRVHLLGQARAELAARRDVIGSGLAASLLHLARRTRSEPAAWDGPAGRRIRDEALHVCRGGRQSWVRISQHVSVPRVDDPWRYRLASIASDDSLDRLLIAWLFELDELRYDWTRRSQKRLEGLSAFWHRYAARRDQPLTASTTPAR